jgi:hypothetical protein
MSDYAATALALVVYKSMIVGSGTFCVYLGYRLFCRGVLNAEGDIEANWGNAKISARRAVPGTVIAVFGCALIGITAYRGLHLSFEPVSSPGIEQNVDYEVKDSPSVELDNVTPAVMTTARQGVVRLVRSDGKPATKKARPPIDAATKSVQAYAPIDILQNARLNALDRRIGAMEQRLGAPKPPPTPTPKPTPAPTPKPASGNIQGTAYDATEDGIPS